MKALSSMIFARLQKMWEMVVATADLRSLVL